MALADDLGNLILRLNPYTNRDIPDSDPPLVAGGMDPYLNSPSRGKTPPISARLRWNWTAPTGKSGPLKGSHKRSVWLTVSNIDSPFTSNLHKDNSLNPCTGLKTTC